MTPETLRPIVLLSVAGFASQAMVRAADSLLPQIAADLAVSIGAASIIVSLYTLMHGAMQLVIGPVGDRLGKFRAVALACAASALIVAACGLAGSLTWLALARVASGATAAWIIPLGMAYIGDVIPYERRQQVLGSYLSGQIVGQIFGQAAGGVLGDILGWRAVFFVLAALFAAAAAALFYELAVNPRASAPARAEERSRGFAADYAAVFAAPWARVVITAVFLEAALMWGAFAYVGADLNARFALSFTAVGLCVGAFGLGGLAYALSVSALVRRRGPARLARDGGLLVGAAYLLLAFAPSWGIAPIAIGLVGLGFYMLHNTLQTNATQMAPQARGTGVALFSLAIYAGQTAGVALWAPMIDRIGARPAFLAAAIFLPALGLWFASRLRARPSATPT